MTDNKKKQSVKPLRPLTPGELRLMTAVSVRNLRAYQAIGYFIDPEHYGHANTELRVVMAAVKLHMELSKTLPGYNQMLALAEAQMAEHGAHEPDKEDLLRSIKKFLKYAFEDTRWNEPLDSSDVHNEEAAKIARRFSAQGAQEKLQSALMLGNNRERLPELLKIANDEYQASQQIGKLGRKKFFYEGWMQAADLTPIPTGISFIDKLLDGGVVNQEVVGIMAPYCSYKTLLATMFTAHSANIAQKETTDDEHVVTVHVPYEALPDEMRRRLLSYAAETKMSSITAATKDPFSLSTCLDLSTMKPYEQQRYKRAQSMHIPWKGERERIAEVEQLFEDHMIILDDFSGGAAGYGGIPEIRFTLDRYISEMEAQMQKRVRVRMIVIDYVVQMARRYVGARMMNRDQLRHYVTEAPGTAKAQLAATFNCPIIMFQQLSTKANAYGPTADIDGTESAEGKGFKENLDQLLIGNKPTDSHPRLARLRNDKPRRSDVPPHVIARLDGELGRLVDASDSFTIRNNRYVSANEENPWSNTDAVAMAKISAGLTGGGN